MIEAFVSYQLFKKCNGKCRDVKAEAGIGCGGSG